MQELTSEEYERGMISLQYIVRRSMGSEADGVQGNRAIREPIGKNACVICGYTWVPADSSVTPVHCPACRSSLWNSTGLHRHVCRCCGHRWVSRKERPTRCPECRSRAWDVDTRTYECSDCGFSLEYRADRKVPSRCPRCDSSRWGHGYTRHICRRCGYIGLLRPGVPGRCPLCYTTLSADTGRTVGRDIRTTLHVTDGMIEILDRADTVDQDACVSALVGSGASDDDAEIMVRFRRGMDEISIARDMDISFGRVISVVNSLRRATDRGSVS